MYSLRNIKANKTVILEILKTSMAKGTKLSELEKGAIRFEKVQREISHAENRYLQLLEKSK